VATGKWNATQSADHIHTHIHTYAISIINLNKKTTLFKGFTRGDPWAPSLVKQNLKRTQKNKVITLKKKFKVVTRAGPWVSPFMKQNLNRTQKHEAFTA
jgi:hypothetical protein